MDKVNIFAGDIFLFFEKDWLHTGECILIGEWNKFYIVITGSKCFLKRKGTFREEWLKKGEVFHSILKYVKYNEEKIINNENNA
jgi:hypothetical protein